MSAETARPLSDILSELEKLAPQGTAEDWDNVGLLVGDPSWKTASAVVSIDLTEEALSEAKRSKAKLIVTHHPCIFPRSRGLSKVVPGPAGSLSRLVVDALREGIAVVSVHTNFDRCALEVIESVAGGLGLRPKGRLVEEPEGSLKKLVVFVPKDHVDKVREGLMQAGAGRIGRYDSCTFGAEGEGTFRGDTGTSPFLGKPGALERATEIRLETIFPTGMERPIVKALFAAHPYEEVAFDLYPVEQGPAAEGLVRGLGYGFWGDFDVPKPFSELTKGVRSLFKVDGFWMTQNPPSRVKRVAFVAGKGASFLGAARSVGCDLFITGEAGYHVALDGWRHGLAVMELGHQQSELFFLKTMTSWLSKLGLHAVESNTPTQMMLPGDQQ